MLCGLWGKLLHRDIPSNTANTEPASKSERRRRRIRRGGRKDDTAEEDSINISRENRDRNMVSGERERERERGEREREERERRERREQREEREEREGRRGREGVMTSHPERLLRKCGDITHMCARGVFVYLQYSGIRLL